MVNIKLQTGVIDSSPLTFSRISLQSCLLLWFLLFCALVARYKVGVSL